MTKDTIVKTAGKACLKILPGEKALEIRHTIRLNDKSTFGLLLFIPGGLFLIAIPFIKASDTASKILGTAIGLLLLVISILTLIRQASDRLKIVNAEIKLCYNLKHNTLRLKPGMKVKMKTDVMKIRRVGSIGSDFIIVTHYLQSPNNETPILKFQMDNRYFNEALLLGNEITRLINEKIDQQ